ncbi:DegT/DnrJ/EryC1/StrS family aminotransferase [Cohnella endophytica]|uniref:DegT/DnrJ/EryC1/StrS family aminotransferase n=1 Tax=Cohnella endophytica TaxID=2419778 RepID=A0A494Y254_9BACL|nr:DegT/DnrJ/EryC1/StrS family aminotransferase [Cohnella endophytica]RKP54422.1 DegT/DnrJ/EryC1/StrS family aminotransferase [Cohnella endophytica]
MGILFCSPQVEFEIIREEWMKSISDLGQRGVFVGGPVVSDFEERFAEYTGVPASVGVGNGTDALFIALKALGIGPGDEVITVANTFIATVEAIHHTGALPVLVDCNADDFLIDIKQVMASVTSRTKAIIAVHLYGQMVDLKELIPWASERGIFILEDSAQAAGARLKGKAAGSWGTLGCFSFYPDKNLGALGDGGMINVTSESLLPVLHKLRNHGGVVRYQHEIPGFNSRLDPIQAIALKLKLKYLDEWSEHRRLTARMYENYLGEFDSVILPSHRGDESHVFHLYVVRVDRKSRDELRKQLQKKGILTAVQYPVPVHLTPAFKYLGYEKGSFPNTESFSEEIISLPMNIQMNEASVKTISNEIIKSL